MRIVKVLIVTAVLCVLFIDCMAQADSNKVTRNTLVSAIRKIQADSARTDTTSLVVVDSIQSDTLKCNDKTTSVVIYVHNPSIQHDKPYTITFSNDGIRLEVFSEGLVVYRGVFKYTVTTFEKLLDIISLQQLVKVSPYGESLDGAACITFKVFQQEQCYFMVEDSSGVLNFKGNFVPLIEYLKLLVPDLQVIIDNCEDAPLDNGK